MMSFRTIIVGLMAMTCGVSAAVGVNQLRGRSAATEPQELDLVVVPVAAVEIRRGDTITEDMLTDRKWPKEMVPQGVMFDRTKIVGKMAATSFYVDEPILSAKIGGEGLDGLITEGMRAYAIMTPNDAALVAGLIEPGNKVDVLFIDEQSNKQLTGGGSSTPLLQNIEVLAIGQVLDPQESREVDSRQMRSVTLLVTPDMAARLSLAQQMGTLHLMLRSDADNSTAPMDPVTMTELMHSMYPALAEEEAEEPEPVVVQAAAEEIQKPQKIVIRMSRGIAPSYIVMQAAAEDQGGYLSEQ